jgi:RNA polymerase sigma-70 factor (ECF subfamily)
MAARLTRARKKLMAAGPQLDLPDDATVDARLPLVCRVVQLAYTLGHTAAEGTGLTDEDLAGRAVHLARTLHRQRPTDPEITGLLALVVLGQGRAAGRIGVDGRQLLLTDVDRGTWDPNLVTEGLATSELALAQGIAAGRAAGPIALQAAISAAHTRARAFAKTDWQLIVELYGMLLTVEPNPALALGRCVAVSYLSGPEAGLADLDEVLALGGLETYPYAHAARAQMSDRAGRPAEAAQCWTAAADRARSAAGRAWFADRGAASRVRVGEVERSRGRTTTPMPFQVEVVSQFLGGHELIGWPRRVGQHLRSPAGSGDQVGLEVHRLRTGE